MRIVLAVASLRSSYGGPAISVPGLATALADLGADVGLWAPDGSAPAAPALPESSPVVRLAGSAREALDRFGPIDVLHDNGIWLPHNHRLAVLAGERTLPRVVSPRGMLEPWALAHKKLRKRFAWHLYQRRDLDRAALLHATSDLEALHLARLGLVPPVVVSESGVTAAPAERVARAWTARTGPDTARQRTATFLGRLYPVKGLPMLLRAWAAVRPAGWRLILAGPDEAGHRAELEALVASLGLAADVALPGAVAGPEKTRLLLDSDLFVMPSHQESFGLAAAEALAHGVPVLTTTATPWSSLAEHDCGWLADPDAGALASVLRRVTALDAAALVEHGRRGYAFVTTRLTVERHARTLADAYTGLLRRSA